MSLTIQKNTNISRVLSAEADGSTISVASMSAQVSPGKSMSFSLVISDAELAHANRNDLASALDAFLTDLRAMATENGLPV